MAGWFIRVAAKHNGQLNRHSGQTKEPPINGIDSL